MSARRSLATRLLIQSHRWLGIAVGLMVILWFASGMAIIYVGGMPQLTPQQRLDHLPELDFARIRLTPAQAAQRLGPIGVDAGAPVLQMILDRPAYRFADASATVFADDGTLLQPVDETAGARVARGFLRDPAPGLRFVRRLETADQWTLSLRRALPLLKFHAGDAQGTELYVSAAAAEVVQATTRRERVLAWIATIPHWLYFSSLRQNQPLWYATVVVLAALACLLALLGLALAFTQWRRTRPFDLNRAIAYRGGMRWHYISGAIFGIFALTWAFSGLLSMEPFGWTNVPGLRVPADTLSGGAPDIAQLENLDMAALPALAAPRAVKEVGFRRIHGTDHLVLRSPEDLLVEAATLAPRLVPFDSDAILARLRPALGAVPIVSHQLLREYDDYYYSRARHLPLPVLRVKLGDALQTWLYIETGGSRLIASLHRYGRIERWLYHGLHSLDFRFWYSKRPLWDVVMLTLLLGGLTASSLGVYYGVRNLGR